MKDVYTLADLRDWKGATSDLTKPPLLAVIGDPVAHSRSPQMHQPALDACGIDGSYLRVHLTPDEVDEGLGLMRENGFLGTNVTIPHKAAALAACSQPDPLAQRMDAANTLIFEGDETLGFNTDGPGFVRALRECFRIDLRDLRVLVVGAGGGAGRAVAVQCAVEGCKRLVLANRTLEKAEALAGELDGDFHSEELEGPSDRIVAIGTGEEELERELAQTDLIVNATSLGMKRERP